MRAFAGTTGTANLIPLPQKSDPNAVQDLQVKIASSAGDARRLTLGPFASSLDRVDHAAACARILELLAAGKLPAPVIAKRYPLELDELRCHRPTSSIEVIPALLISLRDPG